MKEMGWRDLQDVAWEGYERNPLWHAEDGGILVFEEYSPDDGEVKVRCPVCGTRFFLFDEMDQIPEGVMDTDPGLDGPYPALDENGKLIEPYDSDEERAEAQKRFTFWTQYTGAN